MKNIQITDLKISDSKVFPFPKNFLFSDKTIDKIRIPLPYHHINVNFFCYLRALKSHLIYENLTIFFFLLSALFTGCGTVESKQSVKKEVAPGSSEVSMASLKKYYPAGEGEVILDEKGNQVFITEKDFEYFQKQSRDSTEMFRVLITGNSYVLRQIRGSKFLVRKPDPGGDALIVEDVAKYDGKIDLLDDGTIVIKLNPKTGKIENVNFGTRTTRVGNFSKIIQNDSTRWNLEHKTQEPTVSKYTVTYYIKLSGQASRDEIKEKLKGEVKK